MIGPACEMVLSWDALEDQTRVSQPQRRHSAYLFVRYAIGNLGGVSSIAESVLLKGPRLVEARVFLVGAVKLVIASILAQMTLSTSAIDPFDTCTVPDLPLAFHAGTYRNHYTGTFVASNALTRVLHSPLEGGPVIMKEAFI